MLFLICWFKNVFFNNIALSLLVSMCKRYLKIAHVAANNFLDYNIL